MAWPRQVILKSGFYTHHALYFWLLKGFGRRQPPDFLYAPRPSSFKSPEPISPFCLKSARGMLAPEAPDSAVLPWCRRFCIPGHRGLGLPESTEPNVRCSRW